MKTEITMNAAPFIGSKILGSEIVGQAHRLPAAMM
jgi:hypothetical protein